MDRSQCGAYVHGIRADRRRSQQRHRRASNTSTQSRPPRAHRRGWQQRHRRASNTSTSWGLASGRPHFFQQKHLDAFKIETRCALTSAQPLSSHQQKHLDAFKIETRTGPYGKLATGTNKSISTHQRSRPANSTNAASKAVMNKSRIEEHKHELPNGVPVEPAAPPPEVIEQRRETMRHGILADMVACRKASPRRAPPSSIPDGGPVGLMCAELSKQAHGFACVMPGSASFCQSVMVVSYLAHQRAKVAAEALWELNREAY